MLPELRQSDYLYCVPQFELDRNDVADLACELKGFHENFADCFHLSESRDNFYRYMSGQFNQREQKSIEPIAFSIEGGKVRAMQRFVSDAPWDDESIARKYRGLANDDLGHPDGAIIFDESGFVKKGDDSVGVARQYYSAGAGGYSLLAQASGDSGKDLQISWPGADKKNPRGQRQVPHRNQNVGCRHQQLFLVQQKGIRGMQGTYRVRVHQKADCARAPGTSSKDGLVADSENHGQGAAILIFHFKCLGE